MVIDWISDAEAQAARLETSVGGLGGWFGRSGHTWGVRHTWGDYIASINKSDIPYVEAIKNDLLHSGRTFSGRHHEYGDDGIPVFNDGTVGMFSARGWGDLMAAIQTVRDGGIHTYMEFYWD